MTLVVDSVSKRFGNVWPLKDVSFEVEGGSVIGLFGGSGSGKTSLLSLISGGANPSGGSIRLGGSDITATKAKDRDITYISGESSPWSKLLKPFAPKHSSGEEQQDLFDAAIAASKKVILLDDPFRRMDADQREECFPRLRKLGKMKGRIIIFASSDFEQLLAIADELAFISGGTIIQSGSPVSVYDEPATIDAARLTGKNNLITARRLTSTDANLPEFHTIEGGHRIFAQNTEKVKLGPINQNVTLAIRPEQITMTVGASYVEENLLKGVVTAVRPFGPTTLIEFNADGLNLRTWVLKNTGLNIGDECMLGMPPHRIRILTD